MANSSARYLPVMRDTDQPDEASLTSGTKLEQPAQTEHQHGPPKVTSSKKETKKQPHSLKRRLGTLAIITLVLGTFFQLVILGFLIYFWSVQSRDTTGAGASPLWRFIVLNGYSSQTVTFCAVILRTALSFETVICTGLAAALLLEGKRGVQLRNLAHFSIFRSINGGPSSIILAVRQTPLELFRAASGVLILVLFLSSLVSQFTSTILLSDFRETTLIGYGVEEDTKVMESYPELLQPYSLATDNTEPGILFSQGVASYPTFAEQIIQDPVVDPNSSWVDTGVVKRGLLAAEQQRRLALRHYDGPAVTHTSQTVCMRPLLDAKIYLRTGEDLRIEETAREITLEGNLSWPSPGDNSGGAFDAFSCDSESCSPVAINCSVPFASVNNYTTILSQFPVSLCLFHHMETGYDLEQGSQVFSLVLSSANSLTDWWEESGTEDNVVRLPKPTFADEWAVYHFGENLALSVSVCSVFSNMTFENTIMNSDVDPREPVLSFDSATRTWLVDPLVNQLGISTGNSTAMTPEKRGIMTLSSTSAISAEDADGMYRNSTNYLPGAYSGAFDAAGVFFQAVYSYANILVTITPNDSSYGSNASIYFCSFCQDLSIDDEYIEVHPNTVLMFVAMLNATRHAAHALKNTFFTLAQTNYYNALPAMDFGGTATVTTSVPVSIPKRWIGLGIVLGLFLLNLACIASITVLFLARTRHTAYGNVWQDVAQVLAEDTTPILQGATTATDDEVVGTMKGGMKDRVRYGLMRTASGRVSTVRRGIASGRREGD